MADKSQGLTYMACTNSTMRFHTGEKEGRKQPMCQEGFMEEAALDP